MLISSRISWACFNQNCRLTKATAMPQKLAYLQAFCPLLTHSTPPQPMHSFSCLQGLNITLEHQHRPSSCIPSFRLMLQGANSPYHPSTTSACKCLFYAWHNLPNALAIALSPEAPTSSTQSQNTVSTHHHTTSLFHHCQHALAPRFQPMPPRDLSTYRT